LTGLAALYLGTFSTTVSSISGDEEYSLTSDPDRKFIFLVDEYWLSYNLDPWLVMSLPTLLDDDFLEY